MALSLGTLFVKLSADPTALARGLETAGTKIQQFGQGVKQTSENLSRLGMTMAGIGIASTALASKFDAGVKAATDDLGNSLANIAVEISRSMLPALKSINDVLTGVANSMRGMDSDTKEAIGTFTVMSGVIFVGAGALTKIIASVSALAPLLTGTLAPALKVASTYFWPIVLAIGAIILVVPLLVQAISDAVSGIKKLIEPLKAFSLILMNNIGQGMAKTTDAIKKSYYDALRDLQFIVPLPIGKMVDKIEAGDQGKKAGKDLANGIEEGVGPVESMLTSLVDGFVDYWGKGADKIKGTFSGFFDGLFGDFEKKMEITLPKLTPLPDEKDKEKKPKGEKKPIVMPAMDVFADMAKVEAARFARAIKASGEQVSQALLMNLGELGGLIQSAVEGLGAGGPIGALVAVAADLLMKTKSFRDLVEKLGEALGRIVELNDRLFGWVFDYFGKVIDKVLRDLDSFLSLFGIKRPKEAVFDGAIPVEVMDEFLNKVEDTSEAFDRLVGSLTNVPAGFRVALARFNSQNDFLGNPIQNGGDIEVNVYIDGKKVHDQIMIRTARDWYVKTGGSMPPIPGWSAPR